MKLPPDPMSYAIGMFEGRGWATLNHKKGRNYTYVALGIAHGDPEPLLAVQGLIGGRVNGPYVRTGGGVVPDGAYKPRYVLMLGRRPDIDAFLARAYPFLSPEKRSEIYIAMAKDTRQPTWSEPI